MTDQAIPRFLGYRRAHGRPGIRNKLLIVNLTGLTDPSARHIASQLTNSVLISIPHGRAIDQTAEARSQNTLAGLAAHPNAGAVLILSADRGKAEKMQEVLTELSKPVASVTLDQAGRDALTFRMQALRKGAALLVELSRQPPEEFTWDTLTVALECGMSDPSSGLIANPLVGLVCDRLIDAGAAAVFGETTEWLGLENALAERAVSPEVKQSLISAVTRRESFARAQNFDLLGNNPNEANIASGLSTIEDKAIGSVAKTGTRPISGVLSYGDRIDSPGLYAMDAPSYTPESLTGLVATGAQLVLFTSGLGNSYVSRLSPTIKITSNTNTADALSEQFDFRCDEVLERPELMEDYADRLVGRMMEVASGALTYGEVLGEDDEVIGRFGETL